MKKGFRILLYVAGGFVLLAVGVGIGSAGRTPDNGATPAVTRTVTVTVPGPASTVTITAQPAAAGPTMPGNGTFAVGSASGDWLPGTWQTQGAVGGSAGNCYWATLSDLSGSDSSIIANDDTTGPVVLTVTTADAGIQVSGCQQWQKIG